MKPELAPTFADTIATEFRISHDRNDHPEIQTPDHKNPQASSGPIVEDLDDSQNKASDETLFDQLREGDREALAILFRRYARLVRGVAYRILLNASEADDLVQDVFLFIFRKSGLFNHELGSARSWIVQVTYHRAVDRRRYLVSRHFYRSVELEDEITGANDFRQEIAFYEQSIEGVLGKEVLKRIDNALSDDQRRTINLHFFEGYTLDEIAGLIGQTIGNVRNHYYRGLEKMRQQIFRAKLRVK